MTSGRATWILWLAFVTILAAGAIRLLPACGLLLPSLGLNFCPARSAALADEIERGRALQRKARDLERELAEKRLACTATPKPAPAPGT